MSDVQIPTNPVEIPLNRGIHRPVPYQHDGKRLAAEDAEQVAKDFESVLLQKLMEQMQRTIPESGLLSSGITKQIQGLFWFYLAQETADNGGLGLWKEIYHQIRQLVQTPDVEAKPEPSE